jgi:type I restriction enzyme S subunit
MKNAAAVTLGKMLQSKDSGGDVYAPYMRAANVQPDGALALDDVSEMWFDPDELNQLSIRSGDVVVVEGGQGGFVSAELCGWGFQNSINRLRPRQGNDGRFLAYYLISLRTSGFIRAYCNVVSMPHLTADKLARLPTPLPPASAQRAIADYLDRETAQIDALIAKQERLIASLRERRDAVLELPLSRLDWSVPMRSVALLIQTGPFGSQLKSDEYEPGGVPVINPSHIVAGQIAPDADVAVGRRKAVDLARHAFRADDVVVARRGELGRCAVVTDEEAGYLCGTGSALIRPHPDRLHPWFLAVAYRTRRNRDALGLASVGSTMDNVNADIIGALRIPVPPLATQCTIVQDLNEQTAKIDTLIAKTERFIKLSKERRTALITAAVTGQIDVCESA